MKKLLVCIALVTISLLLIGIFASVSLSAQDSGEDEEDKQIQEAVSKKLDEVSPEVSEQAGGYVKEFVKKKNIKPEKINNVTKVNFDDLPKEVNIENVNDANLAIYGVSYNETDVNSGEETSKEVFVVTYSVEKLRAQGDLIVAHDKRQFLNFGFSRETSDSIFLETATGVETSLEKGYVMMRHGSITAISTNLEIILPTAESHRPTLDIVVYKNGQAINFGNSIDSSSTGIKKDYDVQAKDTVTFEPGDVISAYVNTQDSGIIYKDVVTLVEIVTE